MSGKRQTAYEAQELAYLEGVLHFTPAGAAGALGNIEKESDFSPTALQASSGATGIAQWQDGRLARLDAFAARRHASPTSLAVQLAFLGHELRTSYTSVLKAGQSATDPAGFAAVWNSNYEISADKTDDREDNATAIYGRIKDIGVVGTGLGGSGGLLGTAENIGSQIGNVVSVGTELPGAAADAVKNYLFGGWEAFAIKAGFAFAGLVLVVLGAYVSARPVRQRAADALQSAPIPVE